MVNALSVLDLSVTGGDGQLLLDHISFDLARGERLGLIGASGSGKSLTAGALCGLLRPPLRVSSNLLQVGDHLMDKATRQAWRAIRGKTIFQIFQSPASALTPARRIGPQLKECCRHVGASNEIIGQALEKVQLSSGILSQFPFQLSGGMKQRVLIAMALILRPSILIADEPTTGLDILTEADILAALKDMLDETDAALIFISHDLRAVAQVADRVLVMDAGSIVEDGSIGGLNRSASPAARQIAEAALALNVPC